MSIKIRALYCADTSYITTVIGIMDNYITDYLIYDELINLYEDKNKGD